MKVFLVFLLMLFGSAGNSFACSFPRPPDFTQAVESATTIAIIRVLDLSLKDKHPDSPSFINGRIEVAEVVKGDSANFTRISFYNGYCGGVHIEAGHYYVIFTSQSGGTLEIARADQSIVSIEGEYISSFPEQNYRYPFLSSVLAFVNGTILADAIDPFPNIERTGVVKELDCNLCFPQRHGDPPN